MDKSEITSWPKCGALSQSQYGFRKGRSCSDLLLTTVDDLYLAQDAKKLTAVVFLDVSKAFDNVRHDLLLLSLQSLGLGGTVLESFFNYLITVGNNVLQFLTMPRCLSYAQRVFHREVYLALYFSTCTVWQISPNWLTNVDRRCLHLQMT